MKERKQSRKGLGIVLLVTYVLMIAALGTYVLPVWRVEMKPLGSKSWSVHDLVKAMPKPALRRDAETDQKPSTRKKSFDFGDVLRNVSRPAQPGDEKKISPTFVIGIFIPIALALTYLLVLLGLFLAPVKGGKPFRLIAGFSILASGYVLAATHYLSVQAQNSFAQGIQQAGQGIFALLGPGIAPQLTIRPDVGLFALFGLTVAVFVVNFARKKS